MKFTKATKPSTVPYGVYRIDRGYLSALRKNDEKVMDPDITDRYCGPVFTADTERGLVDFFVPIDPSYESRTSGFFKMFKDNIFCDLMDFNKMIPCVNPQFLQSDEQNPTLVKFCTNAKNDLLECADIVMTSRLS